MIVFLAISGGVFWANVLVFGGLAAWVMLSDRLQRRRAARDLTAPAPRVVFPTHPKRAA